MLNDSVRQIRVEAFDNYELYQQAKTKNYFLYKNDNYLAYFQNHKPKNLETLLNGLEILESNYLDIDKTDIYEPLLMRVPGYYTEFVLPFNPLYGRCGGEEFFGIKLNWLRIFRLKSYEINLRTGEVKYDRNN